MSNSIFNKQKEYKNEVFPIVEKLYEKCAALKLPFFCAVCVANDEEKTKYEYETLLALLQLDLKDNQIAKMLYSFNGFEVDYPDEVKQAINTLQRYIQRRDDKKDLKLKLHDDQIDTFVNVAHNANVTIPNDLMGKQLTLDDEFFQ